MKVSKRAYDGVVTKDNTFNTKVPGSDGLITKTKYDSVKRGLAKKIEDVEKEI